LILIHIFLYHRVEIISIATPFESWFRTYTLSKVRRLTINKYSGTPGSDCNFYRLLAVVTDVEYDDNVVVKNVMHFQQMLAFDEYLIVYTYRHC
jgi:hypothetical protein